MPHSEVPNIVLSADGKTVTLDVDVEGFDAKTPVEISGYATQENGAIATFYKVVIMPDDSKGSATFTVQDIAVIPAAEAGDGFVADDPIMAVARAADVWVTKLITADDIPQGAAAAWKSDEQTYHSVWKPTPPGGWPPA
jgi:hypothetical protein